MDSLWVFTANWEAHFRELGWLNQQAQGKYGDKIRRVFGEFCDAYVWVFFIIDDLTVYYLLNPRMRYNVEAKKSLNVRKWKHSMIIN